MYGVCSFIDPKLERSTRWEKLSQTPLICSGVSEKCLRYPGGQEGEEVIGYDKSDSYGYVCAIEKRQVYRGHILSREIVLKTII